VLKIFPKDVKLVFKHFPLTRIHNAAMDAARASWAAHQQGKFWEYHDLLFADSSNLNEQKFIEIAEKLGLDMDAFNRLRKGQESLQKVNEDLQEGITAGIPGTPTLFINGRLIAPRSLPEISAMIEAELAKSRK